MRHLLAAHLVTALLVASAAPLAAAPAPVHLDFARAVQMTLASSPVIEESQGQLKSARGAAQAAGGRRWPNLSVGLAASRSNDPLTVFGDKLRQRRATFADFGAAQYTGPGSLDVAPDALDNPGPYDNFNTHLQVTWPIYAGGRASAAVAGAHAQIEAARNGDAAARQAVILEVLRAYEGVRAEAAQLAVAGRARTAAASYLDTARKRHEQGTALKSDVLTAQVAFDQARLAERSARDQLESAREYLRTLVGLPAGTTIAVGDPALPRMPAGPLSSLQARADAANPTLGGLRSEVAGSRAAVSGADAAYRPSFSLVVRRDWNERTLGLSAPSYTIAGVVSWDLFDFGTRRGGVAEADGKLDAAEARARAFAQQLSIRVDRTWRAAREASDRVAVSRAAVAQAGEAQRILALRFGQGLTTITELLSGEARLEEAEAGLVAALYQERVSRAQLLAQLGELDLAHFGNTKDNAAPVPPPAAADPSGETR